MELVRPASIYGNGEEEKVGAMKSLSMHDPRVTQRNEIISLDQWIATLLREA